jgi:methyl-accepting chemotaxis protein
MQKKGASMKLNFNRKILAGSLGIILVLTLAVCLVNYFIAKDGLIFFGESFIKGETKGLYESVHLQNEIQQRNLRFQVAYMDEQVEGAGALRMDEGETFSTTITNQVTKARETVTIPTLKLGGEKVFKNFALVDDIKSQTSSASTIFQVLPGKLLRVSTNILLQNGNRAVGTYIPSESKVYKTVMRGETYYGRATVVGKEMLTAYKPVKDARGKIIAVNFVGVELVTPAFINYAKSINIADKGYAYIMNTAGDFTYHPTKMGVNIAGSEVHTKMLETKEGFAHYGFEGDTKTAYVHYFEPWDWYIAVTIKDAEMLLGVDDKLMGWSIGIGVSGLLLAALCMTFMLKRFMRPLDELSEVTERIAEGDLDARAQYDGEDAIGKTITSVNSMVGELKNKLAFAEGVLNGMPMPSVMVGPDDKIEFVNEHMLIALQKSGSPQNYLGQKSGAFFLGDANAETISARALKSGKEESDEREYKRGDGSSVQFSVSAAPVFDMDGNSIGVFTVCYDLTTVREQEERIKEQNEKIGAAAQQATDVSEQVASASEELAAQIEESTRGSEEQKNRASETATAMEEMNASVLEVARSSTEAASLADSAKVKAKEGAGVVAKAVEYINDVYERTMELNTNMAELGEKADGIGNIINVISDIADQTNLLALNAAIEAARAGDAGRGFAVVADEVRKLAEKTMTATNEVNSYITSIQEAAGKNIQSTEKAAEAVNKSTEMANESGHALEEIVSLVEQTADQVNGIAAASEEQSSASEEISRATEQVNMIATETAQSMNESAGAVTELARVSQQLRGVIDNMTH